VRRAKWALLLVLLACSSKVAQVSARPSRPVQSNLDVAELRRAELARPGPAVGELIADDGAHLFYRYWLPQDGAAVARVLVLLHGIGEHSLPYAAFASHLVEQDVAVYALDLRGHGLSDGRRGTQRLRNVLDDARAFVSQVRAAHPGAQLFLLGESMGGAFALRYAHEYQQDLDGLILVAPALEVAGRMVWRPSNLTILPCLAFCRDRPVFWLGGRPLELSSADSAFKVERAQDSLALMHVSVNYLLAVSNATRGWSRMARSIRLPTLVVQGGRDYLLKSDAARKLHRQLAGPDKQLLWLPEAYHTLFWDPHSAEVFAAIGSWLVER